MSVCGGSFSELTLLTEKKFVDQYIHYDHIDKSGHNTHKGLATRKTAEMNL